jgi:hypothetical protein
MREPLRRGVLWSVLMVTIASLVGCQGVVGPFERRYRPVNFDDPCLSNEEREIRRREALPLPEGSRAYGPRTYSEEPALRGP